MLPNHSPERPGLQCIVEPQAAQRPLSSRAAEPLNGTTSGAARPTPLRAAPLRRVQACGSSAPWEVRLPHSPLLLAFSARRGHSIALCNCSAILYAYPPVICHHPHHTVTIAQRSD